MALSNWDTAAWGWDGEPCNGAFNHPTNGASAVIHKNWVYVRSKKEWQPGFSYIEPTIAEIAEGDISISGLHIKAVRGPQTGVFALVRCTEVKGKGKNAKYIYRIAGGIGCAGYEDEIPIVLKENGLLDEDPEDWIGGSETNNGKTRRMITKMPWKKNQEPTGLKPMTNIYHDHEARFVGVEPSTIAEFITWAEKEIGEFGREEEMAWLAKVKKNGALRFNQGDAYFAERLGKPVPATKPGKVKDTVLSKIVKKME